MNKLLFLVSFFLHSQLVGQPLANEDCWRELGGMPISEKRIVVLTPPEIRLDPIPGRVVIFQDYNLSDLKIGRDEKEQLVKDCLDTLIIRLQREFITNFPGTEFIIAEPGKFGGNDSVKRPFRLIRELQADIAIGIAEFRPSIQKGNVSQSENYDGSKSKTAQYFAEASGYVTLYNSDSLLKSFTFCEMVFLEDRDVKSGLLAVGPSLVKNRRSALKATDMAATSLANKFIPVEKSVGFSLFDKKELRQVVNLIKNKQNEEAFREALRLTQDSDSKVAGRAHYLCAMLFHEQIDFSKAFDHAGKANRLVKPPGWDFYYSYLKKFVVDNHVRWK